MSAQVPLLASSQSEAALVEMDWRAELAERMLQSGLASLAERQYRELLAVSKDRPEASREALSYGLVAALIAQSEYRSALELLDSTGNAPESSRRSLYRLIAAYGMALGDGSLEAPSVAQSFYESWSAIELDQLGRGEWPWYYFMEGVLSARSDRAARSGEALERARSLARSPEQAAFFDSLLLREQLLVSAAPDNSIFEELRARVAELRGQAAGYAVVAESAVLLARTGRTDEALALLDRELSIRSAVYTETDRAQLFLLKALLLGVQTEAGRSVLMEMIRVPRDRATTAIALQLLLRNMEEAPLLLGFISQVITQSPAHPLIAQLYFLRAQLALSSPETAAMAESDARFLLEQYPGAREVEDVYRLLSYAALQRQPSQYRVAAEYLLRLRELTTSPEAGFRINRQIGDCYFLNRDFANAVDFYREADRSRASPDQEAAIFFRLATAEIRAGQLDRAIRYVDEVSDRAAIDPKERWMSEWNLARALMGQGRIREAEARVGGLLAGSDGGSLPMALDLRLRWLSLYLRLQENMLEGLESEVRGLLARVEAIPPEVGAEVGSELGQLRAEFMLLLAESLFAGQATDAGVGVLRNLRAAFPGSPAAERTFLIEASHQASSGNFRAAQSALVELADTYPSVEWAPQALFEAALYCERRGPSQFGEAIIILNRLVERYPNATIVFQAGMKQGDLLRLMNDFASAQLLFENLINSYPGHPQRYLAELAYADCLVALARQDSSDLSEAAALLDRLSDLPGLPEALRVEVGYKLALVLQRSGLGERALTTLTQLTAEYLLNPQKVRDLGEVGSYWLSRAVIELGSMLETSGRPLEAQRLYRKIIALNLPGRRIVSERLGEGILPEAATQ